MRTNGVDDDDDGQEGENEEKKKNKKLVSYFSLTANQLHATDKRNGETAALSLSIHRICMYFRWWGCICVREPTNRKKSFDRKKEENNSFFLFVLVLFPNHMMLAFDVITRLRTQLARRQHQLSDWLAAVCERVFIPIYIYIYLFSSTSRREKEKKLKSKIFDSIRRCARMNRYTYGKRKEWKSTHTQHHADCVDVVLSLEYDVVIVFFVLKHMKGGRDQANRRSNKNNQCCYFFSPKEYLSK